MKIINDNNEEIKIEDVEILKGEKNNMNKRDINISIILLKDCYRNYHYYPVSHIISFERYYEEELKMLEKHTGKTREEILREVVG